ncbi:MAG: O-acetyl-ADP-ribose deacetylase [Myxococcales bacterium]|nr:O-acetyl-ADP-ribose deacetylase [Myxococcales bacterium]
MAEATSTLDALEIGSSRLELVRGDITAQSVDAIVNAANSSLMGGGGVDGAIHRKGGPAILEACRAVRARQGRLATGDAVATTAGELDARWVIHTVGPVYNGGDAREPELLASCYRRSLEVARELGATSVAFPSVSTGIYGYPVEPAAAVALSTVREQAVLEGSPALLRFVLFDQHTYDAYAAALGRLGSAG